MASSRRTPRTLKSLLASLQTNPDVFISEYEACRESIRQDASLGGGDYEGGSLLSTLAGEAGSWTACVKWRLVELWRDGTHDTDAIGACVCAEMQALGILERGNPDLGSDVQGFMRSLQTWEEERRESLSQRELESKREIDMGIERGREAAASIRPEMDLATSPSIYILPGTASAAVSGLPLTPASSTLPAQSQPRSHRQLQPQPEPEPQVQAATAHFQQPLTTRLLHRFRIPIELFLHTLFYIVVVYFLVYCLLFLIQQIPIIGPAIIFLVNQIDALIPGELPTSKTPGWVSGFNISDYAFVRKVVPFVSSSANHGLSNIDGVGGSPVTGPTEPLLAAMDNTYHLTQISLQLLPVAKVLEFSSYSLMTASSVAAASDLQAKERLVELYSFLLMHTQSLGTGLSDFEIGVETLIQNFNLHLNFTIEKIKETVAKSNRRHANPLWEMVTHTATLTSGACSILPVVYSLNPGAWIACSISLFLSTQGHCYLLSKAEHESQHALLHPVCAPTRYLDPVAISGLAKQLFHAEAQILAKEFSGLLSSISDQADLLLWQSHECHKHADLIRKDYLAVGTLRRENEHDVLYSKGTFTLKAQYTPTWSEWLVGGGQGLSVNERFDGVRLDIQWRDLKELESIQRDADFYLSAANEVLRNMQGNLYTLAQKLRNFMQAELRQNSWHALLAEMERLVPVLAGLDHLQTELGSERQKVAQLWRDRWDYCMRQRRSAQQKKEDIGKGWEDCLLQA